MNGDIDNFLKAYLMLNGQKETNNTLLWLKYTTIQDVLNLDTA
jgi:hypothetical protein